MGNLVVADLHDQESARKESVVVPNDDDGQDLGPPGPTAPAVPGVPASGAGPPTYPREYQPLIGELASFRDILDGKTKWGEYLQSKPDLRDAREALRICWRYHPDNTGTDPKAPRRKLGDIEAMREDLLHLSAIGVRLAAISAAFEAAAAAADNERKVARSRAWAAIDTKMRRGEYGEVRFTVDDKKHAAETSIVEYYRVQIDLEVQGRILSWVRASVRDMVETMQVLIQSSMREERADAKLQ